MLRNERGFTLIEIIAVLVILGILAAVAVPKYLDMQTTAKTQAAMGQVAEMKGTLSSAWGKTMMASGGSVAGAGTVLTTVGFTSGTATNVGIAPDIWNVTLTAAASQVTILVNSRGGDTGYASSGTWSMPQ